MFTATILDVYGTGSPQHNFFSCRGTAIHRSPKRAMELAQERANRQEGTHNTPVYRGVTLLRGNTVILQEAS